MITADDIKGIAGLLVFSVLCAFAFNALSPYGIAVKGQWEENKGVVHAVSKSAPLDNSIDINNPSRIIEIVQNKERVILDARHPDFYEMGHLPGALSWPLESVEQNTALFQKNFKKDTPIMVYCSGITCPLSHTLANHLKAMGYTDVKVFPGGYEQWIEMGGRIEE